MNYNKQLETLIKEIYIYIHKLLVTLEAYNFLYLLFYLFKLMAKGNT